MFHNGFDPQNVVNRRLRVFCHTNEPYKSTSLVKSKQKSVRRQGIKWSFTERKSQTIIFIKEDGARKEKERIIDFYR